MALVHTPKWHGVLTLNLLEFLSSAVSIYTNTQQRGHRSHVIDLTDRSSYLGWAHKESSDPSNEGCHDTVAKWMGWALVSNEAPLYYQHIKLTKNIIVDSLLRDFNI